MNDSARFAYAQARLHARHGSRPTEQLWLRLAGTGNLAIYIQQAQQTILRPWVQDLQADRSSHAIELSLRRHFRGYVDEVVRWLPGRWAAALRFISHIPDLPALQHLLRGEAAPAWVHDDPELRPFAADSISARLAALHESDRAYLAGAWQRGTTLHEAWLDHWRDQWPGTRRYAPGLASLGHLYRQYLQPLATGHAVTNDVRRGLLETGLVLAFRRYSCAPAAACAHLGLVALDLEKLRGELLQRALFAETPGERA